MPDGQAQEHTQDVAVPQAAPAQQEEHKPSLFDRLRELGQSLNPAEVPGGAEIGHVLGGLIKAAEHDGLTVSDELFPEPAQAAPVGAGPGGAPSGTHPQVAQHEDRIGRIEGALEDLIAELRRSPAEPEPEPAEPPAEPTVPPVVEPPAEPIA